MESIFKKKTNQQTTLLIFSFAINIQKKFTMVTAGLETLLGSTSLTKTHRNTGKIKLAMTTLEGQTICTVSGMI